MKMNHHSRRGGFTLLEIMLVVMIIALLAGIAIVKMGSTLDEAGDATAKAQINSIKVALLTYRSKAGNYPTTDQGLKALIVRPTTEPVPRSWASVLETLPEDPWHHPYIYENPGRHHTDNSFDLYSAGRNGKPGDDDDITDWDQAAGK